MEELLRDREREKEESGRKCVHVCVCVRASDRGLSAYLKEPFCQALGTAGQKASNKQPACKQTIQWLYTGWRGREEVDEGGKKRGGGGIFGENQEAQCPSKASSHPASHPATHCTLLPFPKTKGDATRT